MADSLEEWKLNFRKSHEDDASDVSDADTSQGMHVIPIQEPPEARRETWNRFSLSATRSHQPYQHLDFGLLASRTVREYTAVVLSHPVDCKLWR